ncbi:MAG TPA: M1 family metallopeptidase [Gemmatimonadales bacterium]|nr:M1 family metallopeptidase [Gemmatimonadales bacterium]
MPRSGWLLTGLLLAACASNAPTSQPSPADGSTASTSLTSSTRPRPYPVFETKFFKDAVAKGTRTRTGAPGPRYWQQWARYQLAADYDPASGKLDGTGTVTYFNRSPDTLAFLVMHIRDNAFAPNAQRNRVVPITDGVTMTRVALNGTTLEPFRRGANSGYQVSGTILAIRPAAPVLPGDSVTISTAWTLTVPPDGAPRGGRNDNVSYVSYWYPQMAVYDDVEGWTADLYRTNSEFYMGYGDYDVSLTVPEKYLVTSTGVLQNVNEVLQPAAAQRLALAPTVDTVVHVATAAQLAAGEATRPGTDGKLTWHFTAKNVRDVSWGTSAKFNWDATHASTGTGTSAINAFWLDGDNPAVWGNEARYVKASIEILSKFLWPYPYPSMTAVHGPESCGGMEYPMMTCLGGSRDTTGLFGVTVHETGHMWFPMQVGSNEKRYSWQDEGLTQFDEGNAEAAFFSTTDSATLNEAREGYLGVARSGREVEIMRWGDLYPDRGVYSVATYLKTATALNMMRAILGPETFMKAYREYGRRWQYKHPTPYDLWNTFNDVSGRNLDWFWRSWFFETWHLDQAVASVMPGANGTTIVIEDKGLVPMPSNVTVTYDNGKSEVLTVPVETWLNGATRATLVAHGGTVTKVEIDAAHAFADVEPENNLWSK